MMITPTTMPRMRRAEGICGFFFMILFSFFCTSFTTFVESSAVKLRFDSCPV